MPIGSMYGILFTYIWLLFVVNVSKYTIHGSYGMEPNNSLEDEFPFQLDDF